MLCKCGNTARYVTQNGTLTCAICPIKDNLDSVKLATIPEFLAWARRYLDFPWLGAREELAEILGIDTRSRTREAL